MQAQVVLKIHLMFSGLELGQYLMPFVESQKFTLSKSCRLHLENDLFREQEGKMEELRPMQWQCGYCKKVFRGQNYLDNHFDNRHSDKLGTVSYLMLLICSSLFENFVQPEIIKVMIRKRIAEVLLKLVKHTP